MDIDKSGELGAGQWSDGTFLSGEIIEKMSEEENKASQAKTVLIDNLVLSGKISPQYAHLLQTMQTATLGKEGATLRKVKAVLAMRDELEKLGIINRYTANIGAGLDWHFPVALGARKIVMVDEDYKNNNTVQKLLASIRQFDSRATVTQERSPTIGFSIDVGKGKEDVILHLDQSEVTQFHSQSPLQCVVEYAGPSKGPNRSRAPVVTNVAQAMTNDSLVYNLDYPHNELYLSEIGMTAIEHGGFYLYKVTDLNKLATASQQTIRPPEPNLNTLRTINRSRH